MSQQFFRQPNDEPLTREVPAKTDSGVQKEDNDFEKHDDKKKVISFHKIIENNSTQVTPDQAQTDQSNMSEIKPISNNKQFNCDKDGKPFPNLLGKFVKIQPEQIETKKNEDKSQTTQKKIEEPKNEKNGSKQEEIKTQTEDDKKPKEISDKPSFGNSGNFPPLFGNNGVSFSSNLFKPSEPEATKTVPSGSGLFSFMSQKPEVSNPFNIFGNTLNSGTPFSFTGGLFGNTSNTSLFSGANQNSLFSGSVPKFTVNKNNDDSDDGGDDDDENADKKSESENEAEKNRENCVQVYSPYDKLVSLGFEDLKEDAKDGIGSGLLSIEKKKEETEDDSNKDESSEKKPEQVEEKKKVEFPLLVIKTKAKVVLQILQIVPKLSQCIFLKNNNCCVSLFVYKIEKDSEGKSKLVKVGIKIKFAEETQAKTFSDAFNKLI